MKKGWEGRGRRSFPAFFRSLFCKELHIGNVHAVGIAVAKTNFGHENVHAFHIGVGAAQVIHLPILGEAVAQLDVFRVERAVRAADLQTQPGGTGIAVVFVGGSGIGELPGVPGTCELQKMYCLQEVRGTGIPHELIKICFDFAAKHYEKCYLETLESMIGAQRFYEKNGFKRVRDALAETGHDQCDVRYIRDL